MNYLFNVFDDDAYFEKLKVKVAQDINFQSQYYGERHLKRRFTARMRVLGIETYRDYIKKLEREPEEYNHLIKILTVNVTEWFRDKTVWDFFKKQILPEIISRKERENARAIRIWSAGCSDGKEPYSIAMVIHDVLGTKIGNFYINIYASDIDNEMLAKCKKGWYPSTEMKGITDIHLRKYFDAEGEGYQIKSELQKIIKFEKLDITSGRIHPSIDLLFFRNVGIYFNKELKERLYNDFYNSLKKGGYFFMGKTESLLGDARPLFKIVNNRERVYLK